MLQTRLFSSGTVTGRDERREADLSAGFSRCAAVLCSWAFQGKMFVGDLDINVKAVFIKLTNLQFTKLGGRK